MVDRALVVGLGSIGARHLRLMREALPKADIRVLRHSGCDGPIEHADGCFDTLHDACGFAPELAVIASPAPFHLASAKALADAGAHLLVEKPISHRVEGVAELVGFCKAQGRVLHVGYNLRFLETLQYFRTALRDRAIGPIHAVRCEIGQYLPDWRPAADYRDTVSARKELGGGVLLELSHELDLLRWLFGTPIWLSAWTGRQGALEIDVEDSAMLQMEFDAGTVAQVGIDFLRRDTTRVCTAIGAEGSLRWDAIAGRVDLFTPETKEWVELQTRQDHRDASFRAQIGSWLGAIKNGKADTIAAKGEDGLAVMRMIEAARRSDADEGRRISLEAGTCL